jgi:DNA-binding XRE family transcriptional regulator
MDSLNELANREPPPELPAARERAKLRRAFGVTQAEIAKALGVTRQSVISWERGSTEPAGKTRQQYAELLRTWQSRAEAQERNRP